jgi:hypothetical protein
MSQQLLRRAWDALDTFKQAYPENWHEDDQQVLDDLIKTDLDLSGVKRRWVGLTVEEMNEMTWGKTVYEILALAEAKLREKNT